MSVQLLDLRKICRDARTVETRVTLGIGYEAMEPWLTLGQVRLRPSENRYEPGVWELAAYLENATDSEHDSAFALKLDLVGVQLGEVAYGQTVVRAWLRSDVSEGFCVPPDGYDPRKEKGAVRCKDKQCDEAGHWIVPDGFYVPPINQALFELVRGRRVEIHTGRKAE